MDINDKEALIRLLDKAMTSDNETVKEMLQSLLVTVSLIHADDKLTKGPLNKILSEVIAMRDSMAQLQRKMSELESKVNKSLVSPSSIPRIKPSIYDDDDEIRRKYRERIKQKSAWDASNGARWDDTIKRMLDRLQKKLEK